MKSRHNPLAIMLLIAVIIFIVLAYTPANGEAYEEQKRLHCMSHAKSVVFIQDFLLRGVTVDDTFVFIEGQPEWAHAPLTRNLNWAVYYMEKSPEFLQARYFRNCLRSDNGALGMVGPEEST